MTQCWDSSRWLAYCAEKGSESPDPRTKIGCVIVGPDNSLVVGACNRFPTGIDGTIKSRAEAPFKYTWIEHAERNAIYDAARRGLSTEGCIIFVELSPCVDCARAIIQAGLAEVVINLNRNAEYMSERYSGEHPTALEMLAEAGVRVRFVSPGNIEDRVQEW